MFKENINIGWRPSSLCICLVSRVMAIETICYINKTIHKWVACDCKYIYIGILLATLMGMFHIKFKEIKISVGADGKFRTEGVQE